MSISKFEAAVITAQEIIQYGIPIARIEIIKQRSNGN